MSIILYVYNMDNTRFNSIRLSRGERNAIISLVLLIVALFIVPRAYIYYFHQPIAVQTEMPPALKAFIAQQQHTATATEDTIGAIGNPYEPVNEVLGATKTTRYFPFNPNEITEKEWQQLGFTAKQAAAIERYKQRGGVFRKPEDLKRLYVVTEQKYTELYPYIQLPAMVQDAAPLPQRPVPKTAGYFTLDINEADSSMFEQLRGIGPTLARRIVNYRNRLGGFVSVAQIAEVWGMPDSTYRLLLPKLTVNAASPHQLNINHSPFDSLKAHPYINYTLAKVIVNYRQQHGPFASVEAVQNVPLVTDSIYRKLQPYLTTQ